MAVLKVYSDLLNEVYEQTSSASGDYSAFGGTIDTLILFAENRIFREVRCREMEQTLTSTVTISAGVVPLPADYVELKYARLSNESPSIPLTKRSASWIYQRYPYRSSSSQPRFIARENGKFIFGPYPDSATTYTLAGVYWGRPESVIGKTATASMNPVFATHPDLYVAAAVVEARTHLKRSDEPQLIQRWEDRYQRIKRALWLETNDELFEGSEIIGDE